MLVMKYFIWDIKATWSALNPTPMTQVLWEFVGWVTSFPSKGSLGSLMFPKNVLAFKSSLSVSMKKLVFEYTVDIGGSLHYEDNCVELLSIYVHGSSQTVIRLFVGSFLRRLERP